MYLFALSLIATTVLFFTSKTEQSRIVAIHRPLVITQERKTPAYYVYQQVQKLQNRAPATNSFENQGRAYLGNLQLPAASFKIQISEMTFSKAEAMRQVSISAQASIRTQVSTSAQGLPSVEDKIFTNNKYYEETPRAEVTNESTVLSPSKKWATIRGKFELKDGVGIVDHYIELKRVEEGRVRELGRIDLKAGAYAIDIESPQGYLIAQIRDSSGFLVGQDQQKLINLQSRGDYFEGPFIRVGNPHTIAANPAGFGATLLAQKTASTSVVASLFDNQKILAEPSEKLSNVSEQSSTISRISDSSRIYKSVTSIRHTGENSETAMFTNKWLSGAVEYVSDTQKIEFKSKSAPVLLGRILIDGKPARDAQVQIETLPSISPIYFDQFMIPAMNQSATSENGYFMFIGLEPGNYTVVSLKQGALLGSQIFIAEPDSLAFQNIASLAIPQTKVVRTFDAFIAAPVEADVASTETEDLITTHEGVGVIKSFSELGVSEFITRTSARQYLPIRYTQNAKQEYVHIPMIQEAWLTEIKNLKRVVDAPNGGIIIGFTKELIYDAYLAADNYDKNNIVYFNSQGQLVSAPTEGGGFILFNVPVGAHEVVLQDKNFDKIYSQVFNIVSEQISVTHFSAE